MIFQTKNWQTQPLVQRKLFKFLNIIYLFTARRMFLPRIWKALIECRYFNSLISSLTIFISRYEHVPVGSKLELKLGSQPVQVFTQIGTSAETVKLYAWTASTNPVDKDKSALGNNPFLDYGIRNNENNTSTIWASLLQPTDKSNSQNTAAATPSPRTLKVSKILAVVPSRYFSFDIETGGGSVDIAASKEASVVSTKTHGGAITGGSLQASHISLSSDGGHIGIKQLTASDIKIDSNGGNIAVNTLAGLNMNIDGGENAAVHVGACFVEEQGHFSCGKFNAESVRGGTDGSGSIHVDLVSKANNSCKSRGGAAKKEEENLDGVASCKATIGGVDGALRISCNQGVAVIDLQVNEGCRDVMIDTATTSMASSTVALHVAPTLAAHVVLSECGKDWMLPAGTHVVLGEETTRNVYAQLEVEHDAQLGPRSRLQRGSSDNIGGEAVTGLMPCTLAVRGAGRVRVQRRSWMQAREEAFRLKQM